MTKSYNNALDYVIPSAANGGLTVQGVSRYVYIFSCSENLNIDCYDEDGDRVAHIQNFPSGLGQPVPQGFVKMVVTTQSGNAGTAKLGTGTDMGVFTMLTGTVNVLDTVSFRARTLAGGMFAQTQRVVANAGIAGQVQLSNPAASTVNLIVWGVRTYGTAGAIALNFAKVAGVAALTNDVSATIVNKNFGSAVASQAKLYWSGSVAPPANSPFEQLADATGAQDDNWSGMDEGPIIVTPGTSLLLYTTAQAVNFQTSLDWDEE